MTEQKSQLRSDRKQSMEAVITKDTRINLGTFILVVVAAVTGLWQIYSLDKENALRFQRMELKLEQLEEIVKNGVNDRWRKHDMATWAALFKQLNPTIMVPEVSGNK